MARICVLASPRLRDLSTVTFAGQDSMRTRGAAERAVDSLRGEEHTDNIQLAPCSLVHAGLSDSQLAPATAKTRSYGAISKTTPAQPAPLPQPTVVP
jgi:hypothetical protein